jgi:hypothetical protein
VPTAVLVGAGVLATTIRSRGAVGPERPVMPREMGAKIRRLHGASVHQMIGYKQGDPDGPAESSHNGRGGIFGGQPR